MKIEDIELVRKAKKGDRNAFAVLVTRFHRLVNVIVFSHTHKYEETRDLAQEIFLKALEKISELEDASKFRYWLMQIARCTSRNWLARRREINSIETVDMDDLKLVASCGCDQTALDHVTGREIRTKLLSALDSLNPRYKHAILLKYMEGMSYDEMSEALDVSVATVRSRLYRAKTKLQDILSIRMPSLENSLTENCMALASDNDDPSAYGV